MNYTTYLLRFLAIPPLIYIPLHAVDAYETGHNNPFKYFNFGASCGIPFIIRDHLEMKLNGPLIGGLGIWYASYLTILYHNKFVNDRKNEGL